MKTSLKFQDRISFKLVSASVVLALLISFFMGVIQLIWDYRFERDALEATLTRILEVAEPPAARAVHILDEDLAEEVVNGLLNYSFIAEAKILDDLNIELATGSKEIKETTTRWLTKSLAQENIEYSYPLTNSNFDTNQPGQLIVVVDSDMALAEFYDRTLFLMGAGFIRNMLLVLCLVIAFYFMLTRPLVELAEDIGRLNPDDSESKLVGIPKSHEKDELGLVGVRVNGLIMAIRELLSIRKRQEYELLKSKEAVEQRAHELQDEVEEREKAQKEALRSKEIAEIANRSKSEFLANMSHELRTPLNAIIGFSSIMKEQMFGPVENNKYLGYCGDIHGASKHLLEVINDILDVSKIEVGEFNLTEEEMDIKDIIENCTRTMVTTFEHRGQKSEIDLPADLPGLKGDKVRIKQVLFNLLTNASKFTPNGGTIYTRVKMLEDGRISFCVEDTGVGIPANQIEKVMEPFSQVDNAFSRSHDGVGLGLSLCRSLMEMHEGEIWIESEEDIGTKVFFVFPASRAVSV